MSSPIVGLEHEKTIVSELADLVDQSHFFHSRVKKTQAPKLTGALKAFAEAYGSQKSLDVVAEYRKQLDRLRNQLNHCFEKDISLWRSHQRYLALAPKGGLSLLPISNVVKGGPERFWFHQLIRYGPNDTVCAYSEPLFFWSQSLNAYVRFLDINLNLPSLKADALKLRDEARATMKARLEAHGLDSEVAKAIVPAMDFSPVRVYVPAGDAFGISWIRRWFRKRLNGINPPRRWERNHLPQDEGSVLNRIVFASRCTNPSLEYLRNVCPNLRYDLTEAGIRIGSETIADGVEASGTTHAHVVVTNWVFESDHVYTIIASNHTRAAGRVAQQLVAESEGPNPDPKPYLIGSTLVRHDGTIPERMQFAFSVKLNVYESHANDPELIEAPCFYD